jgi:hypothetical protein
VTRVSLTALGSSETKPRRSRRERAAYRSPRAVEVMDLVVLKSVVLNKLRR